MPPSLPVMGFAFAGFRWSRGSYSAWRRRGLPRSARPIGGCVAQRIADHRAGASLLQRGLVMLQAALSLVLLVGAGLVFAEPEQGWSNTDLKLDATNRYIVHINPQAAGYKQTQLEALYRTMEDRFHALPGVVKVGHQRIYTPMEDDNWGELVSCRCRVSRIPHVGSIIECKGDCGVLRLGGNAMW
jgi:macrolide transport system ATP-binding/permease protein